MSKPGGSNVNNTTGQRGRAIKPGSALSEALAQLTPAKVGVTSKPNGGGVASTSTAASANIKASTSGAVVQPSGMAPSVGAASAFGATPSGGGMAIASNTAATKQSTGTTSTAAPTTLFSTKPSSGTVPTTSAATLLSTKPSSGTVPATSVGSTLFSMKPSSGTVPATSTGSTLFSGKPSSGTVPATSSSATIQSAATNNNGTVPATSTSKSASISATVAPSGTLFSSKPTTGVTFGTLPVTTSSPSTTKANIVPAKAASLSTSATQPHTARADRSVVAETDSDDGSNNALHLQLSNWKDTVNDRALLASLSEREVQRQNVIWEVYTTEMAYVHDLETIIRLFVRPMTEGKVLSPKQMDSVFGNIEAVYRTNKIFLESMDAMYKRSPVIDDFGNTFLIFCETLPVYVPYVHGTAKALGKLTEMHAMQAVRTFLKDAHQTATEMHHLDLNSYLIKPVQRLCRYPLLLNELLKNSTDANIDHQATVAALRKVEDILRVANEGIEGVQRLTILQQMFVDKVAIVSSSRYLVLQDIVRVAVDKSDETKQRTLLLFNDLVILAKANWLDRYRVVEQAPLSSITIRAVDEEHADTQMVLVIDGRSYTVTFTNEEAKQKWVSEWERFSKGKVTPLQRSPSIKSLRGKESAAAVVYEDGANLSEVLRQRDAEVQKLHEDNDQLRRTSERVQKENLSLKGELRESHRVKQEQSAENQQLRDDIGTLEAKNREILGMLKRRDIEIHQLKTKPGSHRSESISAGKSSGSGRFSHVRSHYGPDFMLPSSSRLTEDEAAYAGQCARIDALEEENQELKATVALFEAELNVGGPNSGKSEEERLQRRVVELTKSLARAQIASQRQRSSSSNGEHLGRDDDKRTGQDEGEEVRAATANKHSTVKAGNLQSQSKVSVGDNAQVSADVAELHALRKDTEVFKKKLAAAESELAEERSARAALEMDPTVTSKIIVLQQRIREMEADYAVIANERDRLLEELQRRDSLDSLNATEGYFQNNARTGDHQQEAAELRSSKVQAERTSLTLQRELKEAKQMVDTLTAEIDALQNEQRTLTNVATESPIDVVELRAQHNDAVRRLQDDHEAAMRTVATKLTQREAALEKMKAQYKRVVHKLDRFGSVTAGSTSSQLRRQISQLDTVAARTSTLGITTDMPDLESIVEAKIQSLSDEHQTEVRALQEEVRALQERVATSSHSQDGNIDELQNKNHLLAARVQELQGNCKSAKRELKRMLKIEQLNEELRLKLQMTAFDMEKLETTVQELRTRADELARENESQKVELREARVAQRDNDSLTQELRETRMDLQATKRQLDQKEVDLANKSCDVEAFREKLESLKVATTVDRPNNWKDKMNAILQARQEEIRALHHKLSVLEQEKNEQIDQREAKILALADGQATFETMLKDMAERAQAREATDDQRLKQLERRPKHDSARTELEKRLHLVQDLTAQLESDLELRNAALSRIAMVANVQVDFTTTSRMAVLKSVEQVVGIVDRLHQQNESLQADTKTLLEKFNDLKQNHDELSATATAECERQTSRVENHFKKQIDDSKAAYREHISELTKAADTANIAHTKLNERFQVAMAEREALRAQVMILNTRLDQATAFGAQVEEVSRTATISYEIARKEVAALTAKNDDLLQRLRAAEKAKDELDDTFVQYFEKSKKDEQLHATQLADLHEELNTMERWKDDVRIHTRDLEFKVRQAAADVKSRTEQLERTQQELEQLRKDTQDHTKFYSRNEYDALQNELCRKTIDYDQSVVECGMREQKLEQMEKAVAALETRLHDALAQLAERSKECDLYRQTVDNYKHMLKDMTSNYDASISSREKDIHALRRELSGAIGLTAHAQFLNMYEANSESAQMDVIHDGRLHALKCPGRASPDHRATIDEQFIDALARQRLPPSTFSTTPYRSPSRNGISK